MNEKIETRESKLNNLVDAVYRSVVEVILFAKWVRDIIPEELPPDLRPENPKWIRRKRGEKRPSDRWDYGEKR